jgi:hypothetical protein
MNRINDNENEILLKDVRIMSVRSWMNQQILKINIINIILLVVVIILLYQINNNKIDLIDQGQKIGELQKTMIDSVDQIDELKPLILTCQQLNLFNGINYIQSWNDSLYQNLIELNNTIITNNQTMYQYFTNLNLNTNERIDSNYALLNNQIVNLNNKFSNNPSQIFLGSLQANTFLRQTFTGFHKMVGFLLINKGDVNGFTISVSGVNQQLLPISYSTTLSTAVFIPSGLTGNDIVMFQVVPVQTTYYFIMI